MAVDTTPVIKGGTTEQAPLLSHGDTTVVKCPPTTSVNADDDDEDPHHPDDHEDHPNTVVNFFRRIDAIKGVIIVAFIVGAANGVVASVSQNLKWDAFGNDMYTLAGAFGSAKSLLQYLYMPILGAVSDIHGRYYCLIASMASSALPFIAFLLGGDNFWAYSIANVVFGSYGASLALTMMVTLDTLPHKDQTAGFSAVMASFLVGIGGSSFMNGILGGTTVLFAISASLQVIGVIVVFLLVPNKAPGWKRALLKQKRLDAAANKNSNGATPFSADSTTCPVSGATTTPGGKCPIDRIRNPNTDAENIASVDVSAACPDKYNKSKDSYAVNLNRPTEIIHIHKDMTYEDLCKLNALKVTSEEVKKLRLTLKICIYARRVKQVIILHPKVLILCGVVFWNYMTEMMLEEMLLMYLMMEENYSMMDLNIVLAVMSVAGVIGLLFIIDPLRKLLNDMWLLRMSLVANCALTVLYAFVQAKWQGFALPILSMVGMAAYPAVCAVAAFIAGDNTFGVVNGLMGATRQIAGVISPFLYGVLFQASMNGAFAGWPFLIGGGSLLLGLFTTFFIKYEPKVTTVDTVVVDDVAFIKEEAKVLEGYHH